MVDDAFGHWLAGFIDGEGCFSIVRATGQYGKQAPRKHYSTRFSLTLRDDDIGILEDIFERTRIGTLRPRHPRNHESQMQYEWRVGKKVACLQLVELLDKYSLRAKKRRDYVVWRRAVMAWTRIEASGPFATYDWKEMAALHAELKAVRVYHPPGSQMALDA